MLDSPMYRSMRAFSYTVPEVRETTGAVGGDPETAHRDQRYSARQLGLCSLAQKNIVPR